MMLSIMKCEQELFKELNITFYIDEGTLLGAVRDGGFFDADDREDTDWSILSKDTDYLYNLRHLSRERCGFPMIHRSDRAWMPNWLPLVCRRSAFRVFYGYMYPYFYLDIRDYDVVDGKLIDLDNVADLDTGNFPEVCSEPTVPQRCVLLGHAYPVFPDFQERIFPLRQCQFEDAVFPCPKDAEWVLEEEYGTDWRVRKRGFKTWMLEKSYVDEVKEKTP